MRASGVHGARELGEMRAPAGRRKTLLMIDYLFPPIAGPGIQRTLGYVRHLRDYGWEPIVLTVRDGEHSLYDISLLDWVPRDVAVERTASIEPVRFAKRLLLKRSKENASSTGASGRPLWRGAKWVRNIERWMLFPDRRVGWVPFAVARAISLNRRRPIDAIYSSSTNIMTGHLIAYLLKKRLGRPWVADFEDAWLESHVSYFPSPLHRKAAERLEHIVLREADRVTVATEPHRRMLEQRYARINPAKYCVIPMGVDPHLFEGIQRSPSPKFTIAHFGSFYGPRSPEPFLTAVAQCVEQDHAISRDLEVILVGTFDAESIALTERLIATHDLGNIVRLEGVVPYRRGLQHLISADILLLVTDEGIWGRNLLASKLLEYLAAGRPILTLAPEGVNADLVRAANAGVIVRPSDIRAIRDTILRLYRQWMGGDLSFKGNPDLIRRLTWPVVTGEFASILEENLLRQALR